MPDSTPKKVERTYIVQEALDEQHVIVKDSSVYRNIGICYQVVGRSIRSLPPKNNS